MSEEQGTPVDESPSIDSRGIRRAPFAPTLAVLGAAALFGTTGTALAKGPNGIEALTAGSLRLLVGGAGLCLIGWRTLASDLRTLVDRRFTLMLFGGLTVAVYQLGFFRATETTGVALATVVTIGTSPLFSRIIGSARGRPSPDAWWVWSAIGLIIGLILLVIGSVGDSDAVEFDFAGVLAAVLAGASYASYAEIGSEMIVREWHPTSAMAVMFFTAGLMTSPLLLVRDISWFGTTSGVAVIAYLSLVTLTLAYVWFGWGLGRLPPTTVVMLTMFEPVVAAILAIVVLDETLSGTSWLGIGMVLAGLVTVGLRSRPSPPATVSA